MKRRDHLENEQCGVPVGEEIQIEESHILVRALTVVKPYERLKFNRTRSDDSYGIKALPA
eukprot:scaffold73225_cov63-Phaeocystis_antarctica.AAC.2